MVMNMSPIGMSCHNEGILTFCKTESQLLSQSVRFLRCDLSGLEGLTNLVSNHFMPLAATGDLLILTFGQHEFFIHGHGIALIPSDQFTLVRLLRIFCIIRSIAQALGNGFPLIHMHGNQSGCCHGHPLLSQIFAKEKT